MKFEGIAPMFSARPRLAGTLVGLIVTVISTYAAFNLRFFQDSELRLVDKRIRDYNNLAPTPPIVHIDIDDGSLDRIGRWPWHRDVTADLIRVLHELGAKYIMVDLLFSEPEQPYVDPQLLAGGDADAVVGELSAENLIEPDLEFADAIRDSGNVIMAVQLDARPPDAPSPMSERLKFIREKQPAVAVDAAIAALGIDDTRDNREAVDLTLLCLRMRDELFKQFTLDAAEMADRLKVAESRVSAVVAGVKRLVANELVEQKLAKTPNAGLKEIADAILVESSGRQNEDAEDVRAAFARAVALKHLQRSAVDLSNQSLPPLSGSSDIVPLHFALADAALDVAAVSFRSDPDGVVRRVPLLIETRFGYMKHMGFAAAARILDLSIPKARKEGRSLLTIPRLGGEPDLRLPLDGNGNLFIHWTKTSKDWRRGADFPHISAARVYMIADARRRIWQNDRLKRYLMAEIVSIAKGKITRIEGEGASAREIVVPQDIEYREMVNRHLELARKVRRLELRSAPETPDIGGLRDEVKQLSMKIEAEEQAAVSDVEMNLSELETISPEEIEKDAALKETVERFLPGKRILKQQLPALERANAALSQSIETLKKELAPVIRGTYAFVGYAATAEGDIVATPIDPQTNGVMCHAQVLNSILQFSFIRIPSTWYGVLVCLALGTLISYVTATRAPATSLIVAVLLLVSYTLFNFYLLFQVSNILFPAMPCLLAILSSWAFVTLFRQLTAERDKRQFRKQLSQYTSPAIAAKIAESPEAARAFKVVQTREMSCLFTDLKGFTSISEQEDAVVVQHVLNVYLERMSEVIWSHRGMINKFMGDGIMAIFNPSVDPLPDHPRAACEAALGAMEGLERLKKERIASGDSPIFTRLEMRLGLAAGPCMNGDLGSELKADYTVIGDMVNLAARLEPANKVFGTSILVSGPLYEAVKDGYEFRYLAELQVKGKGRTVPVYEVLGKKGAVDAAVLEFARRFEAGVELYKQRKWDECIVHFTRILSRRPDDAGASRYIDACQEMKSFPPGEEWGGALELKEK